MKSTAIESDATILAKRSTHHNKIQDEQKRIDTAEASIVNDMTRTQLEADHYMQNNLKAGIDAIEETMATDIMLTKQKNRDRNQMV